MRKDGPGPVMVGDTLVLLSIFPFLETTDPSRFYWNVMSAAEAFWGPLRPTKPHPDPSEDVWPSEALPLRKDLRIDV